MLSKIGRHIAYPQPPVWIAPIRVRLDGLCQRFGVLTVPPLVFLKNFFRIERGMELYCEKQIVVGHSEIEVDLDGLAETRDCLVKLPDTSQRPSQIAVHLGVIRLQTDRFSIGGYCLVKLLPVLYAGPRL